jgi:hypothetical protein
LYCQASFAAVLRPILDDEVMHEKNAGLIRRAMEIKVRVSCGMLQYAVSGSRVDPELMFFRYLRSMHFIRCLDVR